MKGNLLNKVGLVKIIIGVIVIAIVATIFVLILNREASGDTEIIEVNGTKVTKGEFSLILIDQALALKNEYLETKPIDEMTDEEKDEYLKKNNSFWETKIDGKDPFQIVKERALDQVRSYAYFKQETDKAGLLMKDDERQAFESILEANLIDQGVNIDSNDPDRAYLDIFGVTRKQFMDYRVNQYISEVYFLQESNKLPASDKEIEEHFNKYRYHYASNTVDNIFLLLTDKKGNPLSKEEVESKKTLAEEIKNKIINGENFEELALEYSEAEGVDINKGQYIITKDSLVIKSFGKEFIDWALNANVDDVDIIETDKGINIAKCVKVSNYEGADKDIANEIKQIKYHNIVEDIIKKSEYNPKIINDKAFNQIKKVPGNLVY